MEFLEMLPGWVLLVPFVLLGMVLRVRWLALVSAVIVLFAGLALAGELMHPSGPGTYGGWAVLSLVVLSVLALAAMWGSKAGYALASWFRRRKSKVEFNT